MGSYAIDPILTLDEFGVSLEDLNDSFIIGALVTFCREPELDDVALFGADYVMEHCAQANTISWAETEEGERVLDVFGPPLVAATGTVIEFFENELGRFVRFEEWLRNPDGELYSDCWPLPSGTKVLFAE